MWPLGVRKGRPEELPFGQFAVGNQDQESNAAFVSLTAQAYLTLVTSKPRAKAALQTAEPAGEKEDTIRETALGFGRQAIFTDEAIATHHEQVTRCVHLDK